MGSQIVFGLFDQDKANARAAANYFLDMQAVSRRRYSPSCAARGARAIRHRQYLSQLQTLIKQCGPPHHGRWVRPEQDRIQFPPQRKARRLPLNDPDITGIGLFRDAFGHGEVPAERSTKCGPFTFGFYIFDFSKDAKGKFQLDADDKQLLKDHRAYLYRDGIRVYPTGTRKTTGSKQTRTAARRPQACS